MRTVGVEEELLLVGAEDGRPKSVAAQIMRDRSDDTGDDSEPGGSLGHEIQQQQLETDTAPHSDMVALGADVRAWRDEAIAAARQTGARVVATGTSPMPVEPRLVNTPRFEEMVDHFGLTTTEQLTCGCHVHVSVESDAEAVGVLDRIRVWLPSLLALSANSPFWQGADSGYASFRSQVMVRWPTAGPYDTFGTAAVYRATVDGMVRSGVILDEGMVYLDARVSASYPTVEIRVADVCLDARDTVLIGALCRGLVDTAAEQWNAGEPAPTVSTMMLRLATWRAGRDGVAGDLLDPHTCLPRPAADVVHELVDLIRPALRSNGDHTAVDEQLERVLARGTGATRQRSVLGKTGQLTDVVADLARVTAGQDG